MDIVSRIWRRATRKKLISPRQKMAEAFGAMVIGALEAARDDPEAANERRRAQIDFIKTHYTWQRAATEWLTWLEKLVGSSIEGSNSG